MLFIKTLQKILNDYAIKRKLKFENYKKCLETTKPENQTKYPEKNQINIDILKKKS